MASSVVLQATLGRAAQLPSVHRSEMYTMLQAPSIIGARSFGAGVRGHGVLRRKAVVRLGYRAPSGRFSLPGIKRVKKEASDDSESDMKTGTRKISKLPGTLKLRKQKKDNKVVFVSGATGKVGSRVVRELLNSGFQVRAGVRDVARGEALLSEMADEINSSDDEPKSWAAKFFKPRALPRKERVEFVECDLEKEEAIEDSLGDAGVVVCAIGASEKEVLDVTGPYRIDFKATENLIKAAMSVQVNHFILVSSLGTTKLGWPASVLNLFWGVLVWKAKAEKALEESGLPYTIVRPGGMEKPTDAYKETHNLILAPKNSYSGGQVSSLQVAELIATCVSNLDLAKNKVLEVVAETTAPLRPIEDLLAEVPAVNEEDDQEIISKDLKEAPSFVRKNLKSSRQDEEKSKKAAEADEKKKMDLLARYERDLQAARENEEEAQRKAEEAALMKSQLERRIADLQIQARTAAREAKKAKALDNAIAAAARQGRRLSEKEKKEILVTAAAEFDGAAKKQANSDKVREDEQLTPVVSTNSKLEKGLKFKALQDAKRKEAEDRAAKKSAEKERRAKQEENLTNVKEQINGTATAEVAEMDEKERTAKQESARLENAAKAKAEAEAEANAQAEIDRATEEANAAKARADAEAKARADTEAKAREDAEAKARADAEAKAKADAEAKERADAEAKEKVDAEAKSRADKEYRIAQVKEAREREATAKAKAQTFRWSWQKGSTVNNVSAEPLALSKQQEEGTEQANVKKETASSDMIEKDEIEAKLESASPKDEIKAEAETESNAQDEIDRVTEEERAAKEIADVEAKEREDAEAKEKVDAEAKVREGAEAKESADVEAKAQAEKEYRIAKVKEAREREAIAKAKAQTFRWPWEKESALNDVSSGSFAVNGSAKQNESPQLQMDSTKSSPSFTLSEDYEPEGTAERSEDIIQQPSNGATTPVAEVGENKDAEVPDSSPVAEEVLSDDMEGSSSKPEIEDGGAPPPSSIVDSLSAAFDEVSSQLPDSDTLPQPSTPVVPAIENEASKLAQEVVEDTEDTKKKATTAKEEAVTRAAIALEKARGAASAPFRWPWQQE
ncbi:hypothetical protein KC19_6G169500 [Ceratodon purpureus]|nr:hypothetical protein KC19_6G169500 [Ceratodon purpureus]